MSWSDHLELVVRIFAGAALGAVIGYERDIHGRPAGLRTHTLVGLASSTFMVVSTHMVYFQHYGHDDLVSVDASRIAAAVTTGIGFLAGGAILRTGLSVQGLTTAAGLWLVAALGLAAGGGMFVESLVAAGIGVIALTLLRKLEDKDDTTVHRRLSLTLESGGPAVDEVVSMLEELGARVSQREYERDASGNRHAVLEVYVAAEALIEKLMVALEEKSGISRLRVENAAS